MNIYEKKLKHLEDSHWVAVRVEHRAFTDGLTRYRHPQLERQFTLDEAHMLQLAIDRGLKSIDKCPFCREKYNVCTAAHRHSVCYACRPSYNAVKARERESRATGTVRNTEEVKSVSIPLSMHKALTLIAKRKNITMRHLVHCMLINQLKADKGNSNVSANILQLENPNPIPPNSVGRVNTRIRNRTKRKA